MGYSKPFFIEKNVNLCYIKFGDDMKKGYTLVEVISVIALLSIIGLIVIPIISKSISNSQEKAYESQVELIIEASHKWAIDNTNLLPVDNSIYKLSLSNLINGNYIQNTKNGKLKDPRDSSKTMNGCVYITYSDEYNQYIYEYNEVC